MVQQARLLYVRRLLASRPAALLLVLGLKHDGARLPWVDLVLNDMRRLRSSADYVKDLPDPCENAKAWSDRILASEQQWRSAVTSLRYCESAGDRCKKKTADAEMVETHSCDLCEVTAEGDIRVFATARALKSHKRAKLGVRIPQRFYVEADGKCPECGKEFHSRLRCMRHLTGCHSGECWKRLLLRGAPKLSIDRVRVLDDADRVARLQALMSGHTQPLAVMPAGWGVPTCAE